MLYKLITNCKKNNQNNEIYLFYNRNIKYDLSIFDMIIKLFINDIEYKEPDIVRIQATFISQYYNPSVNYQELYNQNLKSKTSLSKLIITGSSNYGFYLGY